MSVRTCKTCVTSLTLAAVTVAANGMPWASVSTWCLLPDLPRSVGFGPVSSPPSGASTKEASINARSQSIPALLRCLRLFHKLLGSDGAEVPLPHRHHRFLL